MKLLMMIALMVVLSSCRMIEHRVHALRTMDGETIYLSCPLLDPMESEFSYMYSKECYLVSGK